LIAGTLAVYAANRRFPVPNGLDAVYFSGPDIRGERPGTSYVDSLPSTTLLKERRPDFADHPFTVDWRGFIVVPARGTYTFVNDSEDASWIYVRGREVSARAFRGGPIVAPAMVLDAGVHSVFIHYVHDKEECAFELRWARDGDAPHPVPAWALLTERMPFGRAIAARLTGVTLTCLAVVWYVVLAGVSLIWVRRAAARLFTVRRADIGPAFGSVLALSLLLNVCGIWWAMPNTRGWAPDEVVPADVLGAFHSMFSHGWHDKYPPFHYVVLSAADSPILLLSSLGLVDVNTTALRLALVLIGRLVSLAFGVATIVVVYQCGLQLYGRTGAVFAALTTALTVPFAYYSKLATLDVPYLFWFTVSLLAYIRIMQGHAPRDYLLFAASAALAGCTKDQAWGLYCVTPLAIVVARWCLWRQVGGSVVRVVFDATMVKAVAVGVVTFLVADNLVFNFSGFVAHVTLLRGTPAEFQEFPRTVAGELQMAWSAITEMRYMFGWPLAIVVVFALLRGLGGTTTAPSLRWLLVPVLSYYLTFVGVILFFFDRYLLPIAIVLALYAGYWLERFVARGVRARRARVMLVAAVFAYTAVYAVSVDYAMTRDSRYEVTRWLKAHARADQLTASLGPLEYAMLADGFEWRSVESVEDVAALQPAFIVLNADQMPALPRRVQAMHQSLLDGRSGYRLALKVRSPALPLPGRHPDLDARARHGPEFSDLSMINPTMEVFERIAAAR